MYRVLVTEKIPFTDYYKDIDFIYKPENMDSHQWLMESINDADGILITLSDRIDSEIIDAAKKLKVISTYSVGYDHIDVKYALSRNIKIGYTPDVLTESTADFIFGLIICIARRICSGYETIISNKWEYRWKPDFMLGHDVYGKTLGILGLGRIGHAVMRRASGFDMNVIYYNRTERDVNGHVGLNELFSRSDFIVITLPLNDETRNIVNKDLISKMKKTAYIINASRGHIVNEDDLYNALLNRDIAGAALDVFDNEPVRADNRFVKLDNVLLTPHMASASYETRRDMANLALKNLELGLHGLNPEKYVNI
ncbi:2-hydroxyacid dehydrogenase [Picrophilus oshimae]|uniref:Gluconate 2-dehydrogenase n=1 Tax=Picrophilus torridus (strain ATCC 700027 / DSM 9790 / JCM 10055 / NBRC 100828 / KAW 2/3) TaxID=1122961 RepID=A0A8G2FWQ7_PICTO|nr:D-glycerate dehydrogenase [Picrophilus oshimae]SMD30906.1 gluconate 2-dehydrogenase [Picrophilus oshimae DSM 9789]